ncbi:MAG: 4-hydroxy-tetrahydrodipicolinate reductase [Methanomicrobiales archaeon]|nr:4-hydroxy-tetrahydrodipicolinate reductase [Methanomicrobiales archaeon]
MINVAICGALGRMGTTIAHLVSEADDMTFVGGVDVKAGTLLGAPVVESADIRTFLRDVKPDVLIDFTIAHAAVENIRAGAEAGVALVVGTTGFSGEQRTIIDAAIEGSVPAIISSNYSVGMNIFWKLVREAAQRLGDYDTEVIEAHHRYKKDAPSGTARTLLEIITEETGKTEYVYGREGMTERKDEIGVHVIRGGDIVGDHTVLFTANNETIELSHRAYDRAVFAHGVIRAVRFVSGKPPGLYTMTDVLGL